MFRALAGVDLPSTHQFRRTAQALTRGPGWIRDAWRTRRRKDVLPRMLTYTVTFGCNARCIMCDSWKMPTDDDLRLNDIKHIFRQLPTMDVVRLTGGEPLVRMDFTEIANLAIKTLRPLMLHVTSNGFLTKRLVDFCEKRDRSVPLELLISVDGMGEKHNQIRGSNLAWPSVVKSLQELAPRRKELNLKLAVNQTVVDAEGADHYRQLQAMLRDMNVPHHLVIAYDTSATYNVQRELDVAPKAPGEFLTFGDLDTLKLDALLEQAEQDTGHLPWGERIAKRYYLRGIRNRIVHGQASPNPPCVALTSHLRLFPNGDVPTCQFNSRIVGNLREQTFDEVWHGLKISESRDWVRSCPGCWAECEVIPSAVYSLDILQRASMSSPKSTSVV
ncbi:radical SAM protein [Crateriforma spongiae]|uniref:radical SAM protein n=1 Tax=Crateriforma spongiae TaxID=2724528 RepID=UPI0014464DA1|nr:radical SAM protein [Crateriforma spongiae]